MKEWCERCKGKGGFRYSYGLKTCYLDVCPSCNGKGYTESIEKERLLEIGRAAENLLNFTSIKFVVVGRSPVNYKETVIIRDVQGLLRDWSGITKRTVRWRK